MHTGKVILVSMITAAITSAAMLAGFMGFPYFMSNLRSKDNVQVPSVMGLQPDQARMLLGPIGLTLVISEERNDDKVEVGDIAQQNPMQGSWVKKGTAVQVVISTGSNALQVPGLTSLALEEAMQMLTNNSLKVGTVTRQKSDSVEANHVIASAPIAGETVEPNTVVNLIVSDGKQTAVPNVIGRGLSRAKGMLKEAGFEVGHVGYSYDEDRRAGVVLRQDPEADAMADDGTAVKLVVNED
jgi:serine/threonine-protein kinase